MKIKVAYLEEKQAYCGTLGDYSNPDRYEEAWDYMDDNEREWCYEHNLIDLHSGNYGWHNKHIVIIDYAATDCATPSDDDSSDF